MRAWRWVTWPVVVLLWCGTACDPERVCAPGEVQTCPCLGGSEGVQTCEDDGARWGACDCGGADADADAADDAGTDTEADVAPAVCGNGLVEAGEDCDGDPPRACETTCGSTGSQACVACGWEVGCTPPTSEPCNGVDDDCDGETDEGAPGDSYEDNDDCASAHGPTPVEQDGSATTFEATLHAEDGGQDEDWFAVRADEAESLCLPGSSQCDFVFSASLAPPVGADHARWQLCLQDRTDADPICGAPDLELCSAAADWDATAGAYRLALEWRGTCGLVDSRGLYLVVRRTGEAVVSSCEPYVLGAEFVFTDEDCP